MTVLPEEGNKVLTESEDADNEDQVQSTIS